MRTLLTIYFLLFTYSCFTQVNQKDTLYNLTLSFRPATIKILNDTVVVATTSINNIVKVSYRDIMPGNYKIQISGQGQPTTFIDSIFVGTGQKLVLNLNVTGPCLFDHPTDYIPVCPKNHKNKIIPIVYGLVVTNGNTFIKSKKDLKVKYAGCVVSDCDPKFYCKKHDIEF
jgi:hypothetical protein